MPFTPFFGLSIIVHIAIIIGYYLLRNFIDYDKPRKISSTNLNLAISGLIFLFIFVVTIANASILIRASLFENHSSIKYVNNRIEKAFSQTSGATGLQALVPESTTNTPCSHLEVIGAAQKYNNSLVDYLKSKGLDSAFEARNVMALDLGISGYRGLESENFSILTFLLVENRDVKVTADSSCLGQ